jgi:tetrahydromethanopterin S-methyltransferase subunit G
MEDKLFELMTKMYSDITIRLDLIDEKLDGKSNKSDIIHIENKLDTDVKALYDGYKQTYEKLDSVETKVDSICMKLEKQDIELKVLKGGK